MRHRAPRLASIAALAVLAGCDLQVLDGFSLACEPTRISMRGRVIDAVSNEPIAGAHVGVSGQPEVTTDAQGGFDVNVPANSCEYGLQISVQADGYAPVSGWVSAPTRLTIELQPIP